MTDTPQTQKKVNLDITDIENLIRIVDYAAEQGAFKGWDTIRQIIEIRDRVNEFVQVSKSVVEAAQKDEANTDTTETTTDSE